MDLTLPVHILAGGLGIGSGFVALYSAKGAPLHRRAGTVFVCVMFTMTFTGLVLAVVRGAEPAMNVPAALITAYLVVTGWTTARAPAGARGLHVVAMLVAFVVGVVSLAFGFEALANGGQRNEIPAFPFFLFACMGILGGVGDLRMMRTGAPRGAARIGRHLWRMGLALFIATMSFFLGQADEIPEPIRIPALLAVPIVAVLVTMLYWLWRVRIRRTFRGAAPRTADEPAALPTREPVGLGPRAGSPPTSGLTSSAASVGDREDARRPPYPTPPATRRRGSGGGTVEHQGAEEKVVGDRGATLLERSAPRFRRSSEREPLSGPFATDGSEPSAPRTPPP